jgi:hypothetical protein
MQKKKERKLRLRTLRGELFCNPGCKSDQPLRLAAPQQIFRSVRRLGRPLAVASKAALQNTDFADNTATGSSLDRTARL